MPFLAHWPEFIDDPNSYVKTKKFDNSYPLLKTELDSPKNAKALWVSGISVGIMAHLIGKIPRAKEGLRTGDDKPCSDSRSKAPRSHSPPMAGWPSWPNTTMAWVGGSYPIDICRSPAVTGVPAPSALVESLILMLQAGG